MSRLLACSLLLLALPALADECELYLHVDRDAMNPDGVTDEEAERAAEADVPILLMRLQAAEIHDVQIAQMKHQIRVKLDADAKTIDRVKRLVSSRGRFEFLAWAAEEGKADDVRPGTRLVRNPEMDFLNLWIRVMEKPTIDSAGVESAQASVGERAWELRAVFRESASATLAEMAKANPWRNIALVLDGAIVSSFSVPESKWTGEIVLAAVLDEPGAFDLAALLASGPLPAPLKLVDEKK